MQKMRSRAAAWLPWAVAGALLGVSLVTCALRLAEDYHGLLDVALAVTCFWGITRHYRGPLLKPGERIIAEGDYLKMEQAIASGIMEAMQDGERKPPARALRAL